MKDLRKMDIEGIERHKYNFKLFCGFLKERKQYLFFKKIMFIDNNRLPNDLFKEINKANLSEIYFTLSDAYNIIDRKWCAVFSYTPFCKFNWNGKKGTPNHYDEMMKLIYEWKAFLIEHNYDKKQQK